MNENINTIYRKFSVPLLHFLERYVGNHSVAEELLQETWVRVDKGLSSFSGKSSLKTWVFSIARNVAADYLRHPDRAAQLIPFEEAEEVDDSTSAIDKQIIEKEMNACIRKVIDSLPETYRAALILHDLQGFSSIQAAKICEISVSALKIRIHRARKRLHEALNAQCDFYRDEQSVFRCNERN